MPDTLRIPLLLSAWVATLATPALADAPVKGTVSLVDRDGSRILADCQAHTELRMLRGPERGTLKREQAPCYLSGLAVHPPTGRWAVTAVIMSSTVRVEVSGRPFVPPTDKAGRLKTGDLLILGDRKGVVAFTPGNLESWRSDGIYIGQHAAEFTADGARVLVSMQSSTMCQWWSWSFAARPDGLRELPPGMTTRRRGEDRVGGLRERPARSR